VTMIRFWRRGRGEEGFGGARNNERPVDHAGMPTGKVLMTIPSDRKLVPLRNLETAPQARVEFRVLRYLFALLHYPP
jgi:hypothetical protein